jgi:hypothetical protein
MRRVPEFLGVYKSTTAFSSEPDHTIPYPEGCTLVQSGVARFVKHGKAIAMRGVGGLRAGSFECNRADRLVSRECTEFPQGNAD